MMTSVSEYFLGEKLQCSIGIIVSLFSAGLALYFLFQLKTAFYKGMAWPFIVIPTLLIIICAGVIWRVPHDIERVTGFVQQEPEKIQTEEIPRMQTVLRNFKIIKIIEIAMFIAGIALSAYGLAKGAGFITGLGFGLAIQSALLFGFDYFAHNRGIIYFEFLESL